jgi:YVTN family beta-propeller protein
VAKRYGILFMSVVALTFVGTDYVVFARTDTSPVLYVGNSTGNTVSAIDVISRRTIETVEVGDIVHAICSQGDGRRVLFSGESYSSS